MSKCGCIAFLGVLALAGCGGAGSSPQPAPTVAPLSSVTFSWTPGGNGPFFPAYSITLRNDGWAVKSVNGASISAQVPAALSAQVFADVQARYGVGVARRL